MRQPIFNKWPALVLIVFLVLIFGWALVVDWLGTQFGLGFIAGFLLCALYAKWDREDAVNTLPEEGRD